ncbi:MAG: AzlD family protein, partial [Mesorhizobium sp.]
MSTTLWIIIAASIATYLTRIGGHLVISRFDHI